MNSNIGKLQSSETTIRASDLDIQSRIKIFNNYIENENE